MNKLNWLEAKVLTWILGRIKAKNDEIAKGQILSLAVADLFNTITADDILKQRLDGRWYYRGRPLSDEEMVALREDAVVLQKMRLWQVLRLDIRYQLGKKVFEEAKVPLDVVWGQLLTYYDDIIRTRLKKIGALTEETQ